MKGLLPRLKNYISHNSSTILTILSIGGVVGTAVLAAKAGAVANEKIEKRKRIKLNYYKRDLSQKEKFLIAAPIYIPTIVMGAATISCICGIDILGKRKQASLAAAYGLINESYKEYRNKLIELYGEEADKKIRDSIVLQDCAYHQIHVDEPDEKLAWVDELSGNIFYAYEKEIIDAEYHFNRNFALMGNQSLNDWYEFLGLPEVDGGEEIGWSLCDGYQWIDFEHRLINRDDGGDPIYAVSPVFLPEPFEDW